MRPRPTTLSRRQFTLGLPASLALLAAMPLQGAFGQDAPTPSATDDAQESPPQSVPFSFDLLTERMKAQSEGKPKESHPLGGFLGELKYDDYQRIRFERDRARWSDDGDAGFRLNAFHPGWLFNEAIVLHEVEDGEARPLAFSTDDFEYIDVKEKIPEHFELPGVAGFRLLNPLNRSDKFDELVAFLGASYFRALGQGNVYGLSARGLAVNTGLSGSEEFPRFSEFWLERPSENAQSVTFYAALESRSVTGAYRFVIRPGQTTEMDVTARLFLRDDIEQLGIAALTSMYLFGGSDPGEFDDFRPAVHDSEALVLNTRGGETFFRPLNNPPRLASAYLGAENPASFGLVQRTRTFDAYLDAQARYDMRPSLMVEPLGDWGEGSVRLLEIPSDLEVNDNVVAYWTPREATRAGDALEYSYRLHWGLEPPHDGSRDRARIIRTRVGEGGVAGVEGASDERKFVVDFQGGYLRELSAEADVTPQVSMSGGDIEEVVLSQLPGGDTWRLVIEARAEAGRTAELKAGLKGYGRDLTETWLYQWVKE